MENTKLLPIIGVILLGMNFVFTILGGLLGWFNLSIATRGILFWTSGFTFLYGLGFLTYSLAKGLDKKIPIIILLTPIIIYVFLILIGKQISFIPPLIGVLTVLYFIWKEK